MASVIKVQWGNGQIDFFGMAEGEVPEDKKDLYVWLNRDRGQVQPLQCFDIIALPTRDPR